MVPHVAHTAACGAGGTWACWAGANCCGANCCGAVFVTCAAGAGAGCAAIVAWRICAFCSGLGARGASTTGLVVSAAADTAWFKAFDPLVPLAKDADCAGGLASARAAEAVGALPDAGWMSLNRTAASKATITAPMTNTAIQTPRPAAAEGCGGIEDMALSRL
ncbi:hypothetical protein GALL_478110 [mine drainage metagenome]|uniref:Uncharacterized protein n=1 Tax=mine drainage metagenome TaxID=410659 RepID=A0A1J5PG28_9ZZZZ